MKILFYNHTNQVSGAERVLLLILAHLNRARIEPILMCPAGGQLQRQARINDVSCVDVQQLTARFTSNWRLLFRYLLSIASTIREVRARLKQIQPDLVHANSVRAGLVVSLAGIGLRIPIVWHVHDLLPAHPLSSLIRWLVLLRPPYRIVVVARAAAIRFKGRLLQPFTSRVRIDVIYNAIDFEEVYRTNGSAIRRELRLRGDDKLVGIVGNLSPVKGQLELLHAFAAARKQISNIALVVVGSSLFNRDDDYHNRLLSETKKLELESHVRFMGQRDDVPAIMKELDLLVMNSRSEAFPLVALESMAAGAPILATAVGGLPELITHNETGWLIPFGDRVKLCGSMVEILKRPGLSAEVAKRAQFHVASNYPVAKFIANVESIYMEANQRHCAGNETLAFSPKAS